MPPSLPKREKKRSCTRKKLPVITVQRGDSTHDSATIDAFGLDPAGVEARCFRCGELVVHPAIYWHGLSGDEPMYLHGRCAAALVRGLLRDVAELERIHPD
jgi:hypothetical protein